MYSMYGLGFKHSNIQNYVLVLGMKCILGDLNRISKVMASYLAHSYLCHNHKNYKRLPSRNYNNHIKTKLSQPKPTKPSKAKPSLHHTNQAKQRKSMTSQAS